MDKPLTLEQKGVIQQCKDAGFNPDIAITLTLDLDRGSTVNNRKSIKTASEKTAQKWLGRNPNDAHKLYEEFEGMFKQVYEQMAKKCYGSNCKRLAKKNSNKELKMLGGTEITKNGMYHLHCAAVLPEHVLFEDFKTWVLKIWSSFYIGSKQQYKFKPVDDVDGWIQYISKDFHNPNKKYDWAVELTKEGIKEFNS